MPDDLITSSPQPPPKSYKSLPRRGTFTERNALTFQADPFDTIIASNYTEERLIPYAHFAQLSKHYIYTKVCDALGWLIHQEELKENFDSKYHHIQLRYKFCEGEQGIELRHREKWAAVKLTTEILQPRVKNKILNASVTDININSQEFRERVTKWFELGQFDSPETITLRLPPSNDDIEWMIQLFNGVSEVMDIQYIHVDDVTMRMIKTKT